MRSLKVVAANVQGPSPLFGRALDKFNEFIEMLIGHEALLRAQKRIARTLRPHDDDPIVLLVGAPLTLRCTSAAVCAVVKDARLAH